MSMITAFGLHLNKQENDQRARLYVQLERFTFGIAISLDTVISTFMGRPPALSFRYVSCPMLLDIDAETAMDDTIPLEDKLDVGGWNNQNKFFTSTRRRAHFIACRLRHEVLELCFGVEDSDRPLRIQETRARLYAEQAKLPLLFHSQIDRSIFASVSHYGITVIISNRLEFLHSHFLLARIEGTSNSQGILMDVASKMLDLIVAVFNMRDYLIPTFNDWIVWIVS